ncbi:hypothetical protein [Mitsuokella multacida]
MKFAKHDAHGRCIEAGRTLNPRIRSLAEGVLVVIGLFGALWLLAAM